MYHKPYYYYPKKKKQDYSKLFPEITTKINHNGKSISMLQAYCIGAISKEQLDGEILTLTA